MAWAKTVLIGREEIVFGQVCVEQLLYGSFYNFSNGGDDGDRKEVGRIVRVAGFVNWMN